MRENTGWCLWIAVVNVEVEQVLKVTGGYVKTAPGFLNHQKFLMPLLNYWIRFLAKKDIILAQLLE
ncbi:hypothetical protein [Neobacillus niacini]|uniref:hypothetical protein n=1 Tax=Neobacillus niacini TaxID=86668 RepID=UPI003983C771